MKNPSTLEFGDELRRQLRDLCAPEQWRLSQNQSGNLFYWYRLATTERLLDAAEVLSRAGARLCTISAYDPLRESGHPSHEIAYHFDVGGSVVTVTVVLSEDRLEVPSVSGYFRNADWAEREFREMYAIKVVGLTNEKRLFLDEKFDAGIMNRVVPVSVLMNGASSVGLWERILSDRGGKEG